MRRPVSALLALIIVGCVQQPGVPTAKARQSAIPSTAPASPGVAASAFSGGCGATPVVRGRDPNGWKMPVRTTTQKVCPRGRPAGLLAFQPLLGRPQGDGRARVRV